MAAVVGIRPGAVLKAYYTHLKSKVTSNTTRHALKNLGGLGAGPSALGSSQRNSEIFFRIRIDQK